MGEVVLITGCSRGIGLGLVDYFAKAGFKVKILIFQFILIKGSSSSHSLHGIHYSTSSQASKLRRSDQHFWGSVGVMIILVSILACRTEDIPPLFLGQHLIFM